MGGALTCEMNTLGFNPAPLLPDLMPWGTQPAQASVSPYIKCAQKVPLVQGDNEAFVPVQPEMAPSQGFPNREGLVSGLENTHTALPFPVLEEEVWGW